MMHWVGLHHAEKAKAEALTMHKHGRTDEAIRLLDKVMRRMGEYASADPELARTMEELGGLREKILMDQLSSHEAKEMHYQSHLGSRMQRDHRNPGQGKA